MRIKMNYSLAAITRFFMLILISLGLISCATHSSPATMSHLQEGKRDFDGGYYKHAMRELLPLACEGNADAQYAVGYMYYYGYGVAQDSDVGAFWIKRSAEQHYAPAERAMKMIVK